MKRVLLALALLCSATAMADDPKHSEDPKRAGELNDQAMTAYDLGNYERSAELLKQAYEIYPEPDLLYNLGRAYRSLRHYDKAIETYKAYLRKKPQSPYKASVQKVIKEMEDLQRAQEQSNEKPPTTMVPTQTPAVPPATPPISTAPPPPVGEEHWYEDWVGWGLTISGGVGLIVGTYSHVKANSLESDLNGVPETEKQPIRDRIDTYRTIGTVSLVVGGLLVAGGIVKFALNGSSSPSSPETKTSLVVGLGYLGIAGTF